MVPITRKINGEKKEYCIFTREEADEKGLKYGPWREARPGQYAVTDDGYVTECLSIGFIGRRQWSHFSAGRIFHGKTNKLLFEERLATNTFSRNSAKGWVEREMGRERTKNMVTAYVKMVLGSQGSVDFDQLGKIYRPDQKIPAATVKRLLKEEKIKAMINEEMKKELTDVGITKAYILKNFQRAIERADATDNPSAMVSALKELAQMQEMYPEKKNQPIALEFGMTKEISQSLEDARKELPDAQKAIPNAAFEVIEPILAE